MVNYKIIKRIKKITFEDRINELMWPHTRKGAFKHLFDITNAKCHICGLKTKRDLRPIIVRNHPSNPEGVSGYVECIRCILTGGGDCDLGYPQKWKYADREQMIEVSHCRNKWAKHDKNEIVEVN